MEQMKELPLANALDEIASVIEQIKTTGSVKLNGQEVKVGDPVHLEMELEIDGDGAELEFELKWAGATLKERPLVAILCGSKSDLPIVRKAAGVLTELSIASEIECCRPIGHRRRLSSIWPTRRTAAWRCSSRAPAALRTSRVSSRRRLRRQ